ncbi:MAG: type II toxin-antitoxin system HicB family antitoxin [Spirochaetia bacterium]|nr:type II toxin-antitoxin system HicB family antitoxin [Spirochaetia bacterium]
MKYLQSSIKAVITHGEDFGYTASCFDLPVVTQGATLDEVAANLHEAIKLHLEDENLQELGFIENPAILITYELNNLYAKV